MCFKKIIIKSYMHMPTFWDVFQDSSFKIINYKRVHVVNITLMYKSSISNLDKTKEKIYLSKPTWPSQGQKKNKGASGAKGPKFYGGIGAFAK